MDAAAQHENRYRSVIDYANGAMLNVAELDAWATSNKVPVSFETLLKDEHIAENYSADRHFIHYSILSIALASRLVPEGMEPSDATIQLMASGDAENYADPVRRLRDLVMVRYDRQLLNSVYDGDLFLYDSLTMARIDVSAGRLRYEADPDSYIQAAHARVMDSTKGTVKPEDFDQARNLLTQEFGRLDHLAWAIVILSVDAPPPGESRYRQILDVTRWIQGLGLPFRYSNGLPASEPKGVRVSGVDVRESQYLAVADVRAAALAANFWPAGAKPVAALGADTEPASTTDMKTCPEKFTLYWLNAKLDEDVAFAEQALAVLKRMNEQLPKGLRDTTTKASAASALVNEWLVNRDLPCYRRGRAIDDFAAETVEPVTSDLSESMEILEASIDIYRDDVVRLLQREGMDVPTFLRSGLLETDCELTSNLETPEQRQKRRLTRFRALGADLQQVGGGQWRLTGRRGTLAALSREEKDAGHARHDERDVRNELVKAAEAEIREQSGS